VIRSARNDDLPALQDVERAAGDLFRDLGMAAIADDEPLLVAELAVYQADGRAWVATTPTDQPVAYILVKVVDGCAHIEQVSVHPEHSRQGLGQSLLDTAETWAARRGLKALTLTTYTTVPWNTPYYKRLGFQIVSNDELSIGLHQIRELEAARGLARWPRVTMRRPVD
jgi:GNAT superfamily N-acetyltransferase